jgi:hypothetical protein
MSDETIVGRLVQIVGPDYADDSDDLGKVGRVIRDRGGDDYWVQFADGMGTTFPVTSLQVVSDGGDECGDSL